MPHDRILAAMRTPGLNSNATQCASSSGAERFPMSLWSCATRTLVPRESDRLGQIQETQPTTHLPRKANLKQVATQMPEISAMRN